MSRTFHEVTVADRRVLTPGMVRLTFAGDDLAHFPSTGVGDEYLRLFFPDAETGQLALPIIDEKGHWTYPEGKPEVRCATYTIRRFDAQAQRMDIDFVVHAGGVASEWAQNAEPGSRMVINSPRGLYAPPDDMQWQLLMADATGIPALARLLEQTPAHIHSRIFIEVATQADMQPLPDHPGATVTWLHDSGNGIAPSRLDAVFRAFRLPETPGYVWIAGEQKAIRSIRKHVRKTLKLPAERYKLVAYWIEKKHEWTAGWDALDPAVRARIDAAWQSGREEEEVRDEVEAILERHDL